MVLNCASHKYRCTHAHTHTHTDTLIHILSRPCVFPRQYVILRQDSTSSSSQVLSEGSVWRGHPDRNREEERISLLYDAPEPGQKNVVFFQFHPSELMLLANVVDIFFRFGSVFCALASVFPLTALYFQPFPFCLFPSSFIAFSSVLEDAIMLILC